MIRLETTRTRPRRPAYERQVTALALLIAGVFVVLAVASVVLPASPGLVAWLPIHLLLAGAATTAISAVMPFFTAAIGNAPPAGLATRMAAVILVASGAAGVTAARIASPALVGGGAWLAGLGGIVFIAGLVLVGVATLAPLRLALGVRRFVIGGIYGVALANVIAGATLGSLLLLGWLPVVEHWAALKPAHAWLNVFGFVSLVIAGSLLHLLPTVAGARIKLTRASLACFAGVAGGPPLTALGFALGSDTLAIAGGAVLFVGALGLAAHTLSVLQNRGKWTTDRAWHRFTLGSLVSGVAWFVVGTAIAALLVAVNGANAVGWQIGPLIGPIFVGWAAQVLVGAWSHLVPAVGPGSPVRHATQRRILGTAAEVRLVALNVGAAIIAVAAVPGFGWLLVIGLAIVAACAIAAAALLGTAFAVREPAAAAC